MRHSATLRKGRLTSSHAFDPRMMEPSVQHTVKCLMVKCFIAKSPTVKYLVTPTTVPSSSLQPRPPQQPLIPHANCLPHPNKYPHHNPFHLTATLAGADAHHHSSASVQCWSSHWRGVEVWWYCLMFSEFALVWELMTSAKNYSWKHGWGIFRGKIVSFWDTHRLGKNPVGT